MHGCHSSFPGLFQRLRGILRARRGVAAVELGIAAPVFILLLMGVIDFGRAIDQTIRLENAARAGAQYGLVFPDDTAGIEARVRAALGGWTDVTPSAPLTCECATPGPCVTGCARILTVSVSRPFTAAFFVTVTTLSANVVLRIS